MDSDSESEASLDELPHETTEEPSELSDEEDINEPTEYYDILDDLAKKWLEIHLSHNVSLSATYEFWNIGMKVIPKLFEAKLRQDIQKNTPQFVHLRRKLYKEMCPPVHLETQ